jgi:thiosulfate/3-mercaptopyruvate sulfurtransferase
MKLFKKSIVWILPLILLFSFTLLQPENPYPAEHLLDPAELVKTLKNPNAKQPLILNVGSMPLIKNAQSGGMCYSEDNMKEFKDKVAKLDKNQEIVFYCGCCKLETCPNVKLPYEYLKTSGFKNFKILNIPVGLYEDWTSKGYPMN